MKYIEEIKKIGFEKLTPIQEKTFEAFADGKNIVGVAPTGTGKTHAFLMPTIKNIKIEENFLQVIIVVPTNELIYQIKKMAEPLIENIKVKIYNSTIDKFKEFSWLKKNQPHLVISTPEKLLELSENGLNISSCKYLILDEADMMFDEYFFKLLLKIIERIKNAKYLLYSATITQDMHKFIKNYFGNYNLIDTTKMHELLITQKIVKIKHDENRLDVLKDLLDAINPYLGIIFVSKKDEQIKVFDLMNELKKNVVLLSANLTQHQRKNIIRDIRNLKYQYVIASDLLARGMDFDVSHVINYDLPYKLEFFKHRSGRTGRMEKEGVVVSIVSNDERYKVKRLIEMGYNLKEYKIVKNQLVLKKIGEEKKLEQDQINEIKKIPKPKKIKPNYRKNNKIEIIEKLRKLKGKRK